MAETVHEVSKLLGLRRKIDPLEFVEEVESGLPVSSLDYVTRLLSPDDSRFRYHLIPRSTWARYKKKSNTRLAKPISEKLARVARVYGIALDVWETNEGAREFLFQPHMLLDGRKPIELVIENDFGARIVEEVLGRLKYGTAP